MNDKDLCALFVRGIPRELKQKLKVLCAREGVTIREKVIQMIQLADIQGEVRCQRSHKKK